MQHTTSIIKRSVLWHC